MLFPIKTLKLVIVVQSSMPQTTGFTSTDWSLQQYVNAVRWHLQNYNVDAIEIWNELAPPFIDDADRNQDRYAKMAIMTYEQLKPLYLNMLFVGPSTANAEKGTWLGEHNNGQIIDCEKSVFNNTYMLNYRASHGGKVPFDKISWHAYGTGGDPEGNNFYHIYSFDQYYSTILNYTDITGRNVIGNTPIWFTEYGFDSDIVGQETQRIYTGK